MNIKGADLFAPFFVLEAYTSPLWRGLGEGANHCPITKYVFALGLPPPNGSFFCLDTKETKIQGCESQVRNNTPIVLGS